MLGTSAMLPGFLKVGNVAKSIVAVCLLGLIVNYFVYVRLKSSLAIRKTSIELNDSRPLITSVNKSTRQRASQRADFLWSLESIATRLLTVDKGTHSVFGTLEALLGRRQGAADQQMVTPGGPGTTTPTAEQSVDRGRQPCPKRPPDLIGPLASNQTNVTLHSLEELHQSVQDGGHYSPPLCDPADRVAIVVPYRNRGGHLRVLLNNLLPLLIRQRLDFTIFVIEQAYPGTFNRAMLFNIGYLEALKMSEGFTCFVFHDVDIIPLDDRCLYRCAGQPKHLSVAVSKWKYRLPYDGYFGGVVAFRKEQYLAINGGSNLYFGWGGEDDDLFRRVLLTGYKVLRYRNHIGRYDTIPHGPDAGNEPNPLRFILLHHAGERQHVDGLNSTRYQVVKAEKKQLYTWITVQIDMTEVMQVFMKTAPEVLRTEMLRLLAEV